MTVAEIGVMAKKAKDYCQPPEARKKQGRIF